MTPCWSFAGRFFRKLLGLMDTLKFIHLIYGELVNQFGRDSTHIFSSWDQLPEAEREKWVAALAVVHSQIFPHGAGSSPVGAPQGKAGSDGSMADITRSTKPSV
jgi:hypothetical protein